MRQSVINYVKENGIKLAANSKALKLINNGASEAEVAVALQTTKAYKNEKQMGTHEEVAVELCVQLFCLYQYLAFVLYQRNTCH